MLAYIYCISYFLKKRIASKFTDFAILVEGFCCLQAMIYICYLTTGSFCVTPK